MPALTAAERPRSSALTMSRRSPAISEVKLFSQGKRLGKPVMALPLWRRPAGWRPTQPLDGEMEPGDVKLGPGEGEGLGAGAVGRDDGLPLLLRPSAAAQ